MTNTFVYIVDMPSGIHEIVTPCPDGYTIYLNAADTKERQQESYRHAIMHSTDDDFSRDKVALIESVAHNK